MNEFHERAWEATVHVAPAVGEVFGGEVRCTVALSGGPLPGLAGTDAGRRVILFDEKAAWLPDEVLRFIAAHELAHVHMRGFWETLPASTQEGVAEWVAIRVVPNVRDALPGQLPISIQAGSVTAEAAFELSIDGVNRQAYELVEELGFEKVRSLAERAFRSGRQVRMEELLASRTED